MALLAIGAFVALICAWLVSGRVRERERARLRALATEDAALRRVATAVAGSAPLGDVAALVAREAAILLGVDGGTVTRYVEKADRIIVLGQWDADIGEMPGTGQAVDIAPGGAVDRIRATLRPARFDERNRVPTMPPILQRVATPILSDGRLWGALVASSTSRSELPADVEARLEHFGVLVGLAISGADARAQLLAQASTDPLTGLLNHRALHEHLTQTVVTARAGGTRLSLALLDIDRFKQVNDTLGHETGDAVLVEVADRVRAVSRPGEAVGRVGGDEIVLLMPGAGADAARRAAERIRAAIAAAPFEGVGPMSVSIGLCDLEHAADAAALMRHADEALYWSKLRGRDTCSVYEPGMSQVELDPLQRADLLERSRALAALCALARAIDARSGACARHSERVAAIATCLAEQAGWAPEPTRRLRDAALVHDVGKIGVAGAILAKPARLSALEYEAVKRHVDLGTRMVADILDPAQVAWIRGHHERHDGRGYPDAIGAEAIPQGARLLALADAWDAMTSPRSYSSPLDLDAALDECRAQSGTQFDPEAVALLEALAAAGTLQRITAAPAAIRPALIA